ncbi:hypothetical protein KCP71_23095 [Salmonella enterica subsp. enterica]|nr:hypothetical protein KCP71_23095 [Salmonella enterica subsp. enterica]
MKAALETGASLGDFPRGGLLAETTGRALHAARSEYSRKRALGKDV